MTPDDLTDPQRRALAVLAANADREEPRPIRTSNRTSQTDEIDHHEMLTLHRMVAYQLEALGLVVFTNMVLETLALTDEGRELTHEAELA